VVPEIVGRTEHAALVVRTDYDDEAAWRAVLAELAQPWGSDGYHPEVHLVDDPAWAGATPEEVLQAVDHDEYLSVVFVADGTTMRSPHRALLALDTVYEDVSDLDPAYYQELLDDPPASRFRTAPGAVHAVHGNLDIANMDFDDFARSALEDPEGVLRPLQ